jgi:site-specific recombinase XerD
MGITRAAATRSPSGDPSWTVVDEFGLPIEVIDQYMSWLKANGRSINTLRAYAHHLGLLFRWFLAHRAEWAEATFDQLVTFMADLAVGRPPLTKRGGGERDADSVRAVAAAVREFYEFHKLEGRGPADLVLTKTITRSAKSKYHVLAHIEQRDSVATNRLARPAKAMSMQARASQIEIIGFEADFKTLLGAARTKRDALLLSSFYDVGLRVGQSLGLRHSDLDFMRKRLRIERRTDNVNGALSKQPTTFWAAAPARFFDLYRDYLLTEFTPAGIDSDYLYVNLKREPVGRPCSYNNALQVVQRAGHAIDRPHLHPHVLRHTHATALAKAGWTNAEIAARLGQSFSSSADVYIHLASSDLEDKLKATEHLIWPETPARDTDA